MRFHWMDRGGLNNPQDIKIMSEQLDKYNYYSMLLTYHSKNSDLLIKSLLAADKNINLKFMLAIRTYAISPEYLSMICNSYNQSFPSKLILNITSGDIHSEENSINDIPYDECIFYNDNLNFVKFTPNMCAKAKEEKEQIRSEINEKLEISLNSK